MPKTPQPQSVTIRGGVNVTPADAKTPRGRPPKKPQTDTPPEPEKESETE